VRYLTECGVIAALYLALTLFFQAISFDLWQMRVAEALTLLPIFTPAAIPGVVIGCFISNAVGPYGMLDAVIGSSATLIAALLTRSLRNVRIFKLPIPASLPPVIANMVIIGVYLTLVNTGSLAPPVLIANMLSVGLGQFVACCVLGLALVFALEKSKAAKHIFSQKS